MAYLAWIAPVLLLAGVGLVLLSRGRRTARGNRIVLLALGGSALVLIVLALLSLNGRFARRTPAATTQPTNCDTPPAQSPPAKPANASPSSRPDFVTFASCGPGETPKSAGRGR